eukprot:GILJ01009507.1.p1 GENE.GILJ01009507.1~~GILJ01009507.1.p1  ORF type:complete len:317 (+),score=28.31 GILJ01009507.1:226-1176(+)
MKPFVYQVVMGDGCEGPQKHAHGGCQLTALIESICLTFQAMNVSATYIITKITCEFRRLVPLNKTHQIHVCSLPHTDGGYQLRARILGNAEETSAEATVEFSRLVQDKTPMFDACPEPTLPQSSTRWQPFETVAGVSARTYFLGRESSGVNEPTSDRIRIRYSLPKDVNEPRSRESFANVWFGPGCMGSAVGTTLPYANCTHPAAISAFLDEMLGLLVFFAGSMSLAAKLTIQFLQPMIACGNYECHSSVDEVRDRKTWMHGELVDPKNGLVVARAEGLFIKPKEGKGDQFLKTGREQSQSHANVNVADNQLKCKL